MNKSLLMAITACAAMAMTSCSSEDLTGGTTQANETPISFSTYLGRAAESRASVVSGNVKEFGVFAFYTEKTAWASATLTTPNFMNNQKVEGSTATDGTWSYSYTPIKYWPNNDGEKVSFFAYAPYDANKSWATGNTISATIDTDVKKQEDILFAPAKIDLTKQSVSDKITFNFKHALSRIGLQVAYAKDATSLGTATIEEDATTIKVTSVKIGKTTFYTSGTLNLNSTDAVTWKGTGTQDYTLSADNFVPSVANKVTNEYQQLNADNSYLMVIPQDLSTGGFPVEITYTVTTTDNNLTAGKSEITNTINNTVKLNLEAGKAYTLRLLLGMTSVKVSASVSTWETGSTEDVDLPANK